MRASRHLSWKTTGSGIFAARALCGGEPCLGRVPQPADAPRLHAGLQRRRHRDLALADPAQRPRTLPSDADRGRALFGNPRPVEDQHTRPGGHSRAQKAPDAPRAPVGLGEHRRAAYQVAIPKHVS